jgi:hypothetical protein
VIDRLGKPPSVATMADAGARLQSLVLEHPAPARIEALYRTLDIAQAPIVTRGKQLRYRARIETPGGLKELT